MNKNVPHLFLLLIFFNLHIDLGYAQISNDPIKKVKLRLPADLYYEMTPYRKGNPIVFTADSVLAGLALIASDNKTSTFFTKQGDNMSMKKKKDWIFDCHPAV